MNAIEKTPLWLNKTIGLRCEILVQNNTRKDLIVGVKTSGGRTVKLQIQELYQAKNCKWVYETTRLWLKVKVLERSAGLLLVEIPGPTEMVEDRLITVSAEDVTET